MIFDDKRFNPFVGAGALNMSAHDFNGDAFDHSNLDFVGGATLGSGESNGRPINNRPTPPGSVLRCDTTDNIPNADTERGRLTRRLID